MGDDIHEWLRFSDDDFVMAQAALERGKWNWAAVCCQQAIEKRLKALIVASESELPPRTHNLPLLADEAGVEGDETVARLLADLTSGYIAGRYPPVPGGEAFEADEDAATELVEQTREVMVWLDQLLRSRESPDKP